MLLNDFITIVAVNKDVIPNNQRRKQLAFLEDIFFQLLVLIVRQRRDLATVRRRGVIVSSINAMLMWWAATPC